MLAEIQSLVDGYHGWLRGKTSLKELDEWIEITTPYLDRHNDHLQIFARKSNGHIELTDDGYTIRDLELSGCNLETPKRKELLHITARGFGIEVNEDGQLYTRANSESFSKRKHGLLQAMLAVNDLFYVAQPHVASLFKEDVQAWLDLSNVRYTPSIKFAGKSGYDHLFDFAIPPNRATGKPERIVQAVARPSRDTAATFILSWVDSKESRPVESEAYVVLNDSDLKVPTGVIDALRNYSIHPVAWSERESVRVELAA